MWVRLPNQSNSIKQIKPENELNPLDCVRLGSAAELNWTQPSSFQWVAFDCVRWVNSLEQRLPEIMLCVLENMKSTSYTELTQASKSLLLIFSTSFTKNQEFRNQKFDLVRLSNYFYVSSIWFDCWSQSNEFDLVRLKYSSIGFDWLCREKTNQLTTALRRHQRCRIVRNDEKKTTTT